MSQPEPATPMSRAKILSTVAAVVVLFPTIVLFAGATYLALRRRWPDRLLAAMLAAAAAPLALSALWWSDYLTRWSHVFGGMFGDRRPSVGDWVIVAGWGLAIGPIVGAGYWRWSQRRRERSPYSGEDEKERRQRAEERRRRATTHTAQRLLHCGSPKLAVVARPLSVPLGDEVGPYLGKYQRGDLTGAWRSGGAVCIPLVPGLARHIAVLGATGLGKTETTLGICEWAASRGWQVVYLSCKEPPSPEQSSAPRLAALADGLGLTFRGLVSDNSPFDPMRGSADDVRDRLVRIEEWGDRYWAHCANLLVGLALDLAVLEGKSIGTLPELVYSLLKGRLAKMSEKDERVAELVEALDDQATSGALIRYASLAMHLRNWVGPAVAGGWAWEDGDVICAELPTGSRPEAGAALLRLMIRDFESYLRSSSRRQKLANGKARPVMFVVEEAGAVAGDPVIGRQFIDLVERARSSGAYVAVTAQDPLGLGDERAMSAILTNAAVVTYRQTAQAEAVAQLAGTRRVDEGSAAFSTAGAVVAEGSTRRQHAMKLSPQMLRELGAGECVAIHGGKFALVAATMTKLGYAIPQTEQVTQIVGQMLAAAERAELQGLEEPQPAAVREEERPEWQ